MTNRRSFLSSLLLGSVAPLFLPGTGRIWKPSPKIVEGEFFSFNPIQDIPKNYYLRVMQDGKNLEWFSLDGDIMPYNGIHTIRNPHLYNLS